VTVSDCNDKINWLIIMSWVICIITLLFTVLPLKDLSSLFVFALCRIDLRASVYVSNTGWLKIKYPTRQYAISSQPVVGF